ncbi:hypothetical protein [Streptomyces shaanxiensis]|uniref:Uncharacterized protein n=1 Tax=Streptomyces shaanxiensis TaxID=653357 RepID=A0ABP7W2E4_9ACTN
MRTARRRTGVAVTLVGVLIAAIGLIIYIPASIDSDAADEAPFRADADKRIAEEDKTFGLVLIGLGAAVTVGRWAVRPQR